MSKDASDQNMKSWRVNYLTSSQFQLYLMALVFFSIILMVAISIFLVYLNYQDFIHLGEELGFSSEHQFYQLVALYHKKHVVLFLIIGAIFSFFTTLGILVVSHRMVGPLFRLRKHLQEVSQGNPWKPVSFRKKDFLKDHEGLINEAFNSYNSKE